MKIKHALLLLAIPVILIVLGFAGYFFLLPRSNPKVLSPISTATGGVGDFVLLDHNGDIQKLFLNSNAKAVVVIAYGNSCPIIQKYSKRINELNEKYSKLGVVFLMIDPNLQDTRADIIAEAKEYGFNVPILLDPSQIVTKSLGITRTSEAVIISPRKWEIVFRGAIDDQIGFEVNKQVAQNNYLSNALDKIIADKTIDFEPVAAKGCAFTFFEQKEISYTKTIAPILVEKCLNCHSTNGYYTPFFDSYEKLRGWSMMIRETLFTDRMPPFSADPHYGKYSNDISLSPKQKRLLVQWIDAGLPRDGTKDPLTSTAPSNSSLKLKKLGKPLYEVSMDKPQKIPPGGMIEYKYYQLSGPIPRDMWITTLHTSSSSPRQLHHEALMVTSKPISFYIEKGSKIRNADVVRPNTEPNTDGDIPLYLLTSLRWHELNNPYYTRTQAWAAGQMQPFDVVPGSFLFLPKGHYLILEAHYMGTGKDDSEQTTIKFFGSTKKPKNLKQYRTGMLTKLEFEIPPNKKKYVVSTNPYQVPRDIKLVLFRGHMHMRGRATKLIQTNAKGESKILAAIPNYYYKWQSGANLNPEKPILIKAGSILSATCEYDNSAENPNNPDAQKTVRFGQRLDRAEMCLFHIGYIYANEQ